MTDILLNKIYRLRNVANGLYVGIENSSAIEVDGRGARLKQRIIDSDKNKKNQAQTSYNWYFEQYESTEHFLMRTMHGMYAAKIDSESKSNNKGLRLRSYENYANKVSFDWKLVQVEDKSNKYYIKNINSGRFMCPNGHKDDDAVSIYQMDKIDGKLEYYQWFIEDAEDTYESINWTPPSSSNSEIFSSVMDYSLQVSKLVAENAADESAAPFVSFGMNALIGSFATNNNSGGYEKMLAAMEKLLNDALNEQSKDLYIGELSALAVDYQTFKNLNNDPNYDIENSVKNFDIKVNAIQSLYTAHSKKLIEISNKTDIFKLAVMPWMAAVSNHICILYDLAEIYYQNPENNSFDHKSAPVTNGMRDLETFGGLLKTLYDDVLIPERANQIKDIKVDETTTVNSPKTGPHTTVTGHHYQIKDSQLSSGKSQFRKDQHDYYKQKALEMLSFDLGNPTELLESWQSIKDQMADLSFYQFNK